MTINGITSASIAPINPRGRRIGARNISMTQVSAKLIMAPRSDIHNASVNFAFVDPATIRPASQSTNEPKSQMIRKGMTIPNKISKSCIVSTPFGSSVLFGMLHP